MTAYAFGFLAATCVIFGVVWVVIWVRGRITENKKREIGGIGGQEEGMMMHGEMMEGEK